jgi:hypothetical protein
MHKGHRVELRVKFSTILWITSASKRAHGNLNQKFIFQGLPLVVDEFRQ